jgi:hypothetical protein
MTTPRNTATFARPIERGLRRTTQRELLAPASLRRELDAHPLDPVSGVFAQTGERVALCDPATMSVAHHPRVNPSEESDR